MQTAVPLPVFWSYVGHQEVIARRNCATAVYAHGCASPSPVKWPVADLPGSEALGNWYARLGGPTRRFARTIMATKAIDSDALPLPGDSWAPKLGTSPKVLAQPDQPTGEGQSGLSTTL